VTDANLVLGRLVETEFLGGEMRLDGARAEHAVGTLARRLGWSLRRTAEGIVEVANVAMERAVRVVTVERGHDPREFTLLAFGGAGGLHAAELAASLGMPRVYVPRQPGLLSAWGMLAAEPIRDHSRTLRMIAPPEAVLRAGFGALAAEARRELARDGTARPTLEPSLDVRYAGQSYEVRVPYRRGWVSAFHRAHARLFGHADPDQAVEVVTLRLRARGGRGVLPVDRPTRAGRAAPIATRAVVFSGVARQAPVHRRDDLAPGQRIRGPAVVCEYSATTLVPPAWRLVVDRLGGLVLEHGGVR
jgi:N-methylhydantoinase A